MHALIAYVICGFIVQVKPLTFTTVFILLDNNIVCNLKTTETWNFLKLMQF